LVEHIVLFKWKSEATAEQITAALEALRAMPPKIAEIKGLTCGETFTDRGRGYTHGLVVRLPDRAALDVYQDHPDHQAVVVANIRPIVEEVLAIDYEF
jgi:hypothetical protein